MDMSQSIQTHDDPQLLRPVRELGLKDRIVNSLHRVGIYLLGQLLAHDLEKQTSGLGAASIKDIKKCLAELGYDPTLYTQHHAKCFDYLSVRGDTKFGESSLDIAARMVRAAYGIDPAIKWFNPGPIQPVVRPGRSHSMMTLRMYVDVPGPLAELFKMSALRKLAEGEFKAQAVQLLQNDVRPPSASADRPREHGEKGLKIEFTAQVARRKEVTTMGWISRAYNVQDDLNDLFVKMLKQKVEATLK